MICISFKTKKLIYMENGQATPAAGVQNEDKSRNMALGKVNFIIIGVALVIILMGFIMMSGSGSTMEHFNPEIFSTRRIIIGPNVCLFGYILIIVGILINGKK